MPLDTRNRPIRDLRISVTDRCNLRCSYCMPRERYPWLDRREILTYEEIERLARLFVDLGVEKVRLTGGEPLVRTDVEVLIGYLTRIPGLRDLSLTTNGQLLADRAGDLRAAGLRRINVSLDTLDPERFRRVTRRGDLGGVLEGLRAARDAGLRPIKINMVVERGVNDHEIVDMVRYCREEEYSLRLIEFMDVGNSNGWKLDHVVTAKEMLETIRREFRLRAAPREQRGDTAERFVFADGRGDIGVIASVSRPFCGDCSRVRLTADGRMVTCLFSNTGTDLKTLLRRGATDDQLKTLLTSVWIRRRDRYSEERLEKIRSEAGYDPSLRTKIEMITLGG
jgi:cyclic pyranopterin phosphate synthase